MKGDLPQEVPRNVGRQDPGRNSNVEESGMETDTPKLKSKTPPPVADINVTPMVDVMLVLLIIFMVITPMLSKGVSVDLVKTRNPIPMQAADKSDAILVAVTRDGNTFLNTTKMQPEDLPAKVKDLLTNRLDKTVFSEGRFARSLRESGGRGGQPARGGRGPVGSADGTDPGRKTQDAGCRHPGGSAGRAGRREYP